jgi:tetratricopeptide (TPR) repeat protein
LPASPVTSARTIAPPITGSSWDASSRRAPRRKRSRPTSRPSASIVNLGRLLHEDGAPAAAEHHYRAALEVDAAHETATFNLGVALEDLGHLNEAIEMYRRSLTLDPDNADAHYNLAGIYERRGDKAAALRHMKSYAKMQKGA